MARHFHTLLLSLAAGCAAMFSASAEAVASWTTAQAQPVAPSLAPQQLRKAPARNGSATAKEEAKPTWAELDPAQQQALAPLAASWQALSAAHKRKWIALSRNYPGMLPEEQALLHSRMTEWIALTPQQRAQARLNFAETKKVPADDKKAMWEAYQALPPEEKRRLAAGAAEAKPPTPPTAAAVQPVPQQKLATVPARKKSNARVPRIAAAPEQVDQNTLLPQPGAEPAPAN